MVRFIDEAKIYVLSGAGGDGCVSFRREKFIPRGGPDGGDGGNGGDVIIEARENLTSLLDFRYKRHYKARGGEYGKGKKMAGKSADSLIIPVPVGTIIKDFDTGAVIADLNHPEQRVVVCKGGMGGRGNTRFKSSTNQAPRTAEPGSPGEEKWLKLELKLLADVGLLGFPNAGKSTLISRLSAATPKIADYPFTTLIPNLGVVTYGDGKTFVIADIPGLIEGAHKGAGLGISFLKHIERTRVLIHLLDLSPITQRDPFEDYLTMNRELKGYGFDLENKPQIVVANKVDLTEARESFDELSAKFEDINIVLMAISAATGQGLDKLVQATGHLLESLANVNTETTVE